MKGNALRLHKIAAILLVAATLTGFTLISNFFEITRNIELLGRVYREVAENYVDEIDVAEFMLAGIDGMLSTLDPYTVFMDEDQSDDLDQLTTGKYAGVGISIHAKDNVITIMSVEEGYSADKAGMRIGDVIIEVDGYKVQNLPLKDIQNLIKGESNTEVNVTVRRDGEPKPITFNLIRHEVTIKNVTYVHLTKDNIGYVDIQRFSVKASDELSDAIQSLEDSVQVKGEKLKGLILDLRDDPGGLLKVAVSVASKFLEKGSTVVTTAGRDSSKMRTYVSSEKPQLRKTPLVVLINERSASASEIVAGAIQDLDRGIIVGASSYGKGLVQTITQLPYNTKLKITTSKYFTPSGRLIQKVDYFKRNKTLGKRDVLSNEPDSMKSAYTTTNGRKVYGGGGIVPDVIIKDREMSELERQLRQQSMIFKFANVFRSENPSLPKGFLINEDILIPFDKFLKQENFEFKSSSEQIVDELISKLSPKGEQLLNEKAQELRSMILNDNKKEFQRQKEFLLNLLAQEIYLRYDRDKARELSFKYDNQFHEAKDILTNPSRYKTLLTGVSR